MLTRVQVQLVIAIWSLLLVIFLTSRPDNWINTMDKKQAWIIQVTTSTTFTLLVIVSFELFVDAIGGAFFGIMYPDSLSSLIDSSIFNPIKYLVSLGVISILFIMLIEKFEEHIKGVA